MVDILSKKYFIFCFVLWITPFLSKGQLPDFVGSLINTERTASYLANSENAHQGLSYIIDKKSTFYVPSPVNAYNYLNSRPNIPDKMSWKPTLALVSRSRDWAVTVGDLEFQKIGVIKRYANYLTVWKKSNKGKWTVQVRAEVENFEKDHKENPSLEYFEPDDEWYIKHRSDVRLGQKEDLVLQNDQLFSSVLRSSNATAYDEFLDDDARLYYPWQAVIQGKKKILNHLQTQRLKIETKPESVGRAYSGEYGYTAGTASVFEANDPDSEKKFNYVRIWKLQDDFQWKVLVEFLFER